MSTERSAYKFPVCLICECEVDESNEYKHQGPTHDVQEIELLPLSKVRERLQALLDGEQHLYELAGEAGDLEGARIHGAACHAFRVSLAAFPPQGPGEEEG